jgi:hypothetical protein
VLDSLRRKEKKLQNDLKHIQAVIKLYEAESSSSGDQTAPIVPLESLRGLTQIEALIKIARASGGKFRIADARGLLVSAGLIKSKKGNEANILFNAISRSDKFRRVGHGEYELVEKKPVLFEPAKQSSVG